MPTATTRVARGKTWSDVSPELVVTSCRRRGMTVSERKAQRSELRRSAYARLKLSSSEDEFRQYRETQNAYVRAHCARRKALKEQLNAASSAA